MGVEGMISNVREVRQRVEQHLRPVFDRRPGALEATRGLALTGAIGTHNANGWEIRLQLSGGLALDDMTIAEARKRAAEILTLCDTLEHGVPD